MRLLQVNLMFVVLSGILLGSCSLVARDTGGAQTPLAWDGLGSDPNLAQGPVRSAGSRHAFVRSREDAAMTEEERELALAKRLVICRGCGDVRPEAGAVASKELFERPGNRRAVDNLISNEALLARASRPN